MDGWEDNWEDNGVTLGPEEALRREIEKCKSLKVERLKLRDELEKLRARTNTLEEQNHLLQEELKTLRTASPSPDASNREFPSIARRTAVFLLVFNLAALSLLIFLLLGQK